MTKLEDIKFSLDSNNNISDEIKLNLFELVSIFNNKFPNIDLTNLDNHLKTLQIKRSSKFLNNDISMYDCRRNILYFNANRMEEEFDFRHVLMFELINMISSNNYQTGFNNDGRFEALNTGYTELLTNYLVGNAGEKLLYPNEAVMANMIGIVIGSDNMLESYFHNDSKLLLKSLMEAGIKL